MTKTEMTEQFRSECDNMGALVAAKNTNYAGNGGGAFDNFDLIEHVTKGRISREVGTFVRITDKLSRLWNLLDGDPDAVGESFEDTCVDLSAYALLMKLMYVEKHEPGRAAARRDAAERSAIREAEIEKLRGMQNMTQAAGAVGLQFAPETQTDAAVADSAWSRLLSTLRG